MQPLQPQGLLLLGVTLMCSVAAEVRTVPVGTVAVTRIAEGRGKEVARIKSMDRNNSALPEVSDPDGFGVQARMLNFLPNGKSLLALDTPMIYRNRKFS